MKRRNLLYSFLAILLIFAAPARAQQTGFPPYGSFQPGGFDTINRQDLNVNFALPIVSLPGRGTGFGFTVGYNSLVWQKISGTSLWYPVIDANGTPTWAWKTSLPYGEISYQTYTDYCEDTDIYSDNYSNFLFTDAAGTVHKFDFQFWTRASHSANCPWNTSSRSGYATDGTFYFMDAGSLGDIHVLLANGIKISADGTLTDTNGNTITRTIVSSTETDWTDTVGHAALKIRNKTGTSNCTDGTNTWPACIEYEYQDTGGNAHVIKLFLKSYDIATNFGCSGVSEFSQSGVNLPDKLLLPNGQSYAFTYEDSTSGHTSARLRRVTLPTGGYYEYQYPTSSNKGISCTDGSVVSLTRVINDGASSNTWTYSRAQSGSDWLTTVTPPAMPYDSSVSNESVYTFNTSGQETSEQFYQGSSVSGTLLKTVITTWATNGTPALQRVILPNGGGTLQSGTETTFDSNGNLTQLVELDWGSGWPGSVLRTTALTYTTIGSNPGFPRLSQKLVSDGNAVVKYRQDIAYDESGYINQSCPSSVAQHDSSYDCSYTTRGNPTTVTTYTDAATPGGSIARNFTYDSLGNVLTAQVNCCQQKSLTYSSTNNYAYPTQVVSGPSTGTQLTTSATYNAYTGQITSSTDENNQTASYAYDLMKRPTSVTRPDSTQFSTSYDDTNLIITTTSPITSSSSAVQKAYFDGLGRPIKTEALDGSSTSYAKVDTQYDPLGRAHKVSNPYTSSASYWTETRFDGLGRPLLTIPPDGSSSSNNIAVSYSANCATATDQTGKQRKSCSDGLGHLTQVFEDPGTGNLNYETDYTYNLLDLLTGVSQGSQARSYTYDDMGRLTQSVTPEAGTFQFAYNAYDLVTSRTDARGVVTSYTYDTLNRLTQVSYNVGSTGVPATSTVSFTYDQTSCLSLSSCYNNGRLTTMSDGPGSEAYAYDQLGRTARLQKVIGGTTYITTYAYNLGNELTSITYPSGRVVAQNYDSLGRLCSVGASGSGCSSGTRYADSFSYNTTQQVTAFNYGNGVAASFGYSADRLQMTSLSYSKSGTTLFGLNYYYKTDSTNCSTGTSGNNGQIQCISDTVDSGRTAHYSYDALARLSTATTSGSTGYPAWGLSWTYDQYGNRTAQSIASGCTGITCPTNSISVSASTNRLTGSPYAYDSNGNMTNDGSNTLVYDAENHVASINSSAATYTYDGNNLRVKKVNGSTTTVYIFSGSKVIAEYDNGAAVSSPTREYLYASGVLVATIDSSGTKYHHADVLSVRATTDSSGNTAGEQGHYPYGESWYSSSTTSKFQFTTYERDEESGNDYAMARYNVNRLGRFSSPDPVGGDIGDPQSFNRYAYVLNNPISLTDSSGLVSCQHTPRGCPPLIEGGDPSGFGCTLDGIALGCDWARHNFDIGVALECLNGTCTNGVDSDGVVYKLEWVPSATIQSLDHKWGITYGTWEWVAQPPSAWDVIPDFVKRLLPPWIREGLEKSPWSGSVNIFPFAFTAAWIPSTNTLCRGWGFGYGFTIDPRAAVSVTAGPLPFGNLNNAQKILSGWSVSGVGQSNPLMGIHATANQNGALGGPSLGTPGAGIAITNSKCTQIGK